jgi:hypothetical protein
MLSAAPVTSVSATRIIAGGPVGMSIMLNQSMGSALRSFVRDAMAQMRGMLILFGVSRVYGGLLRELHRPDDESKHGDERQTPLVHFATRLTTLHAQHALAEFYPDNDNLRGRKQLADVFDGRREPGIEIPALIARTEEQAMKRRRKTDNRANEGTKKRSVGELPGNVESLLQPG